MSTEKHYRSLPSVDQVLAQQEVQTLLRLFGHGPVVGLIRSQLAKSRQVIGNGGKAQSLDTIAAAVALKATKEWQNQPHSIINATGVILHTNLGRAPLSDMAAQAMLHTARNYTDLEFDLATGKRSTRQAHVASLLTPLTSAASSLVVNNNASALLLALTTFAHNREVIVSRGESVEIGGGFRIPNVMAQSGASLIEVGTTNRTYTKDYEKAITENTAFLLKVHTSNFRVSGFTHESTLEELVNIGQQYGIPVIHDLGSGCLLETTLFGLSHEPTPQESIAAGCDLVLFSGDKLLGGPQAGIIIGNENSIQEMELHPLARAVRIDKLSLAGLASTLLHYLKNEATTAIPAWRMISTPEVELKIRAEEWCGAIGSLASVVPGKSTIGGGSLPGETLPTHLVTLNTQNIPGGADTLSQRLRSYKHPIISRIAAEQVILDPRTVSIDDDASLLQGIQESIV
jgi:L-seryl-tRNA(Ser) seleniumtransferase